MEQLKNLYNEAFFERLIQDFKTHDPDFDSDTFLSFIYDEAWEDRALKDRMRHIALALDHTYELNYAESIALFKKVIANRAGESLEKIFFPDYVELFGQEDLEVSLDALGAFTPYASSEFAIRPFILEYEDETMQQMHAWSEDENHHRRRLASEGCRPRLPWAMALLKYKKDPSPILPILERLKADPTDYVRRSVANNLNDISKDHPDLVLDIAKRWLGQSKETDWVVKHACRTLLKQGNPKAMPLFGFQPPEALHVQDLNLDRQSLAIGEELTFNFTLQNDNPEAALIRIEYSIEFVKKLGKTSTKVFHLSETTYPSGSTFVERKQHFKDLSTRKHYPGTHHLRIILNGVEKAMVSFELIR